MMIAPAICYSIKDNKLILDDLNIHQNYVEINMDDVLFIQINQTNNTFHIAFLLNNDEQQYYTLSSLDDVADIKLYHPMMLDTKPFAQYKIRKSSGLY